MYIESPTNILRTSFDNTTQSKRSSTSSSQSKISIDVQFGCVEASIEKSNEYIYRASCEPLIEELSKRISNEHPSRVDRPSNPTNTHRSEHSTKMYQISINCTIQTNRRSNEDPTNIYQRSNEHLPNMYRKPYIDHPPNISRSPIEHNIHNLFEIPRTNL